MKLSHRIPPAAFRPTDAVTAEYQAEVDRATAKLGRDYARAQKRLAQAELRLQAARTKVITAAATGHARREMAVALELVELRREELQAIEALMKAHPASTDHRGRGGYRPVPQPGAIV